ncbi:2-hydroxy-3-oxopropionate reductase [Gemella morbillorum]|uniref:NAD-binding protein n=1 Tax=Gemella morbillorum TaxID=29391 RepID=A0A2X4N8X1_9BACL|nr:NAD(P)-dependent oxidoreductase [Gemella morbillorum]EFV35338.1 ywjF protein [Gemella morbillorum M424]MDK8239532.1 NAD(P)-dependent oxidoreductase [Gemella morbillorum]QGS08863.1 NAD-binding protein [Gemella morbillorum]UBH81089.1 NAD(P)-dependent oxidoreductase [Gemella morbillorum]SQH54849.1 2-hydroxy-3-oxopropionate reductase [Gemella morbillorum]
MKIAWIGIGVMGESMAGHLLDAGHELFVYNRTVSKTDGLVKRGATLLKEVKDAPLNADVIFSMVGYPKDVEEVYLGENGLIKTAKEGQVFVDMTTSSPTLAKKISEEFAKVGATALDLPVTGGDIGAKNGTLSIMAGGDKKVFEETVLPLVKNFGKNITYFGEAGKGQYTKLANQIAIATTMISVAESFKFAKEVGLNLDDFFNIVSTGSGGSFSMTSYGPRILKGDFKPGFFIHHFIKDMRLALEECEKMNIKLPGLETAYEVYNELEEEVRNTNGTQAISKWYKL